MRSGAIPRSTRKRAPAAASVIGNPLVVQRWRAVDRGLTEANERFRAGLPLKREFKTGDGPRREDSPFSKAAAEYHDCVKRSDRQACTS